MAQLQEAQFACFEDEEVDVSSPLLGGGGDIAASLQHQHQQHATATGLKTFTVAEPHGATRSLPQKSFARVRSLECSGSGTFYFQNESLKDRFICWRVIKNIVVLREWSLHETLAGNGVRLQFTAPVVSTGVHAVESWEGNSVTVCVVTHAGAIHRFTYALPATATHSIFSTADASFPPKPATSSKSDALRSLAPEDVLTVALWVNEYNLVLGTDSGRVLGVNFGLPTTPTGAVEMQEFAFADESVVARLWHGLVKSTSVATKWQHASGSDDRARQANAIVAATCFPITVDPLDDIGGDAHGGGGDVCIVTVSADLTLRVWSYASQSCLGKQQVRSLVTADDEDEAIDTFAVHAKLVALPATSSDSCRLLLHVDTTASFSQDIYLLRGDVSPLPTGGRRELALTAARIFTVSPAVATEMTTATSKRLKLVDFAVDKNYLFSCWRSATGDCVFSHANPMALTGPRIIRGHIVSSLNAQMHKFDTEDDAWPFDLQDNGVVELVDNFFAERVLLPGRFSRQNLYKAVVEYHGSDVELPLRPLFSSAGLHESKYKDLLVQIVSDKWTRAMMTASGRDPHAVRIGIWKSIIELCNKHWRVENVPIGFATTTNSLLPGSPVLLRRNRVALLFPSAASITAPFAAKLSASSAECVRELVGDILPVFDAFPSRAFEAFIHREVTDVVSDWKVESFVALARHCVRMGLRASSPTTTTASGGRGVAHTERPDLALTRALLRLSKLLGSEPEFHAQVLRDLVEHLFPFDASSSVDGAAHSNSNSPSPQKRHPSYDDSDDDQSMDDSDASSSADRFAPLSRALFGGSEISFAFAQVAARTVDEMCLQTLRVVLFLSYVVDAQPTFLSAALVRNVARFHLPRAITIYQRWRLGKWIAGQNLTHATEFDASAAKASATLLPPLLQLFLVDANATLNASSALKRARSVLQLAMLNNSVQSEEAQSVLASFTREALRYIAHPTEPLVRFLQKRKHFALLRAMLSVSLSDVSLHSIKFESPDQQHHHAQVQQYVQSIGECLAREGQLAAAAVRTSSDDGDAGSNAHARWCFEQAIRCFSIGLSAFLSDHDEPRLDRAAERFIYDTIGLLKETVPRALYDLVLAFLWRVVTQALNRSTHTDSDSALQTFVWVNVFKFSVEERRFRDAHVALMHTLDVSSTAHMTDDDNDESLAAVPSLSSASTLSTSAECVTYLVKELCRYGHVDLLCELQWGPLEPHVERHLQWQAANANVVNFSNGSGSGVDPSVVQYHELLFAFYTRRAQPANAAAAMHALALRLRFAQLRTRGALETQRNALVAALNALQTLPAPSRWIVRKYHAEELMASARRAISAASGSNSDMSGATRPLDVVTAADFARDIAVLDGKLLLLTLGRCDASVLLSTIDATDVVALLVDAALACCEPRNGGSGGVMTARTQQQQSAQAVELALDIARKSALGFSQITKSLARYCVAAAPRVGLENLCWHLLRNFLTALDTSDDDQDTSAAATIALQQYEVAAATILDWQIKIVLPQWLYSRLAHRERGNAGKLLQLFLTHGLLADALRLVNEMVPDELLSESEVGFRERVVAPSAALPWIPYNLVDAVLDAADAALQQRVAGASALRARVEQLRAKLASYFKYIALLDEARAAAGVAQTAASSVGGFSFGAPARIQSASGSL